MVERGPWRNTLPAQTMNLRDLQDLPRQSWWSLLRNSLFRLVDSRITTARGLNINRCSGTFEIDNQAHFTSVCTNQVGGGSLIWGAAISRPFKADFWDHRAEGVSETLMAPHFSRVYQELGATPLGDALEVPDHWARILADRDFLDFAIASTTAVAHQLPMREKKDIGWGVKRSDSQFCGHMSFGCLDGSKASTDSIYVAPSLARGMTLLAGCEVKSITRIESSGYRVKARRQDSGEVVSLVCDRLILGAGTYNTLRLLSEAERQGGIVNTQGLGLGISGNGDEPALLWNTKAPGQTGRRKGLFSIF